MMAVEFRQFAVKLAVPFISQKGRIDDIRHVMVELTLDGIIGRGVSRIDADIASRDLDQIRECVVAETLDDPFGFADRLELRAARSSLTVACEVAYFDLLGKKIGKPTKHFFGSGEPVINTAITIGAASESEMLNAVSKVLDWPIIKPKVRKEDPAILLDAIRNIYSGEIWVDANGAFDLETIHSVLPSLARVGVKVLEQPFPRGKIDWLSVLRPWPINIALDEDVDGASSIDKISKSADIINIKLGSCGGLAKAYETIQAARRAGLKTIIGCRSESVSGVTAAAALAHATDFADLDGHLDIGDDPFDGITINRAVVHRPDVPGIGASIKNGRLVEE
ncbi:enolase C-terminal domain-like protein [Xanthobacter sp.]|uniref:enolase C-terminal domain-like protein n=1 Tax=Xanthobacter sp. TaxID=35809 RepID=UPI0025D825B0|nr:enolase C-terminal domain-like protein [Xanthobacter sp.]